MGDIPDIPRTYYDKRLEIFEEPCRQTQGVIGSNSVAICIKVTTVLPNFQTGLGTTSGLGIYSDFTSRYPVEIPLFGDMFMYMLSKICRPLCK